MENGLPVEIARLPQKLLRAFRSAFSEFDPGNDDVVPATELPTMLRALSLNPTEKELKAVTDELIRGQSRLSFILFCQCVVAVVRGAPPSPTTAEITRTHPSRPHHQARLRLLIYPLRSRPACRSRPRPARVGPSPAGHTPAPNPPPPPLAAALRPTFAASAVDVNTSFRCSRYKVPVPDAVAAAIFPSWLEEQLGRWGAHNKAMLQQNKAKEQVRCRLASPKYASLWPPPPPPPPPPAPGPPAASALPPSLLCCHRPRRPVCPRPRRPVRPRPPPRPLASAAEWN